MKSQATKKAWLVTLAGLGINLALGLLYTWSVISKSLTLAVESGGWGWSSAEASLPYAIAVGTFAFSMVFAGAAQDKYGPRLVASIGGVLCGVGLVVASFASSANPLPVSLGFGLFLGLGIGLGYASATPAAVKWFSQKRAGFITGLVVAGFGLASVYTAPLTTWMLNSFGIESTFRYLGIAFFFVILGLSQLLVNPPAGYIPEGEEASAQNSGAVLAPAHNYSPQEMLKTPLFYLLWVMYAFAAFAGLMIIGHMAKIAGLQVPGVELGFLLVAVLAIGNAAGRVLAGMSIDRFGQITTMRFVFLAQAAVMGLLAITTNLALLIVVAAAVGFFYGANLSIFPSIAVKSFGKKNLGVNYGLIFTAWGVGGVFGSLLAGNIVDKTGNYLAAYGLAAALCIGALLLTFVYAASIKKRESV